jgi:hypothetical protein
VKWLDAIRRWNPCEPQDGPVKFLIVCIILLLPVAGYATGADEMNLRVMDALAGEYATCAAYYGILSRAASGSGENAVSERNASLRDKAIIYALTYTRKGHGEKAARALTTERVDAAIDSLFAIMGGNTGLVPVLTGKYAIHCQQSLENPGAFADEVLEGSFHSTDPAH